MKVILREDIKDVGKAGAILKVAEGFGRNYLLPKQLAVPATPSNIKRLEQELNGKKGRERRVRQDAVYQAEQLAAQPLVVTMAAGESGKLFGSVTSADLEKLIQERGLSIDKRRIELEEPIKAVGTYTVSVKLHPEVTAQVTVLVQAQAQLHPQPSASTETSPSAGSEAETSAPEQA